MREDNEEKEGFSWTSLIATLIFILIAIVAVFYFTGSTFVHKTSTIINSR